MSLVYILVLTSDLQNKCATLWWWPHNNDDRKMPTVYKNDWVRNPTSADTDADISV